MRPSPAREFIRHTVDVPLEIRTVEGGEVRLEQGMNVSFGGLAFTSDECPREGDLVEVRISTVDPPFDAQARVAWCRPEGESFLVGVKFLDASDAFRSRMVQQVCSIENYRREAVKEGRRLSPRQAAKEWIERYAGRFPGAEPA